MHKIKLKKCERCKNEFNKEEMENIYMPRYVPMIGKPIGVSELILCKNCFGVIQKWIDGKKE